MELWDKDIEEVQGKQPISRVAMYIFHQRACPEKLGGHSGRQSTAKQFQESPEQTLWARRGLSQLQGPTDISSSVRVRANSLHAPNQPLSLLLHSPQVQARGLGIITASPPHPQPPSSHLSFWPSSTSLFSKYFFFIYFCLTSGFLIFHFTFLCVYVVKTHKVYHLNHC